jgi:hypothetical protein
MRALLNLTTALLRCALAFFRSRSEQVIIELALRQQLATYAQNKTRPCPGSNLDRAFWIALLRFWRPRRDFCCDRQAGRRDSPHRQGFRSYWRAISKRSPGRPPILEELKGCSQINR